MSRKLFFTLFGFAVLSVTVLADEVKPVRHWAVEPMSDVMRLPSAEPKDGVADGVVRIVMAKNEYEPGSFVVQSPARDLGKVSFTLSEFKTADGKKLPADALDLKFVKVWYQNRNSWYCYFGDNGRTLCPELLVNDEDLIRCDHRRQLNFAKLVESDGTVHEQWIDPPYQFDHPNNFMPMKPNFHDAKTLQPVALPKGEYKQFFLTVHSSADTPEGTYAGEVRMAGANGASLGAIPVTVRVLPFALPRPKSYTRPDEDMFISCYTPINWNSIMERNGGDRELMLKQEEAIFRDAVAHGQNMLWFHGNVAETNAPWSVREAMMTVDLMNRVGMRTDVLQGGAEPYKLHWWNRKSPITYEEAHSNAEYVAKCADAAFGHHNIFIGYGDEPGAGWLIENRPVFLAFEDVGLKFTLACWGAIFDVNPFAMDWQNIGGSPEGGKELVDKWNQLGVLTAWYAGHHVGPENPAFNRRQYGFTTYFAGYTAICNYENGFAYYNDNTPKYRRMNNVYGTADGVLDTLQWEGFREGIDDIRYATALKQLADRALASDDGETRRIGRKALADCAKYKLESEDLSRFRSRVVDYILALREKVGDITPDKPLPKAKVSDKMPEGDKPEPERWRFVRMYYDRGEFDKACDEYYRNATNNPQRVFRAYSGLVDYVGLQAAYAAGRFDMLKAIAFDLTNKPSASTNSIYEMKFTVGALLADGNLGQQQRKWTDLDNALSAGVTDKFRLETIDKVGQTMARRDSVDRVMAFWEWRESRLKPMPKKHYLVKWSEHPVSSIGDWDSLKLEESVFDRKWKGDFSFLVTDASTGNRGVGAEGVTGGESGKVTMSAVADVWGLHFRFTDRTDDAPLIALGAKSDGSYECYIAPGPRAPYTCLIPSVSQVANMDTCWHTTYDSPGWRRPDSKNPKQVQYRTVCRADRVETYLSLSWSTYFSRIPDGREPWEFEVLRWGKHNSAWNGTHYVHGRNTWGLLDIPLKPAERAQIFRSLLLQAKDDPVIGDTKSYWSDPERGDPEFFKKIVKPEYDGMTNDIAKISADMNEKTALDLGANLLPRLRDFGYTIDRLRTRYAADKLSE